MLRFRSLASAWVLLSHIDSYAGRWFCRGHSDDGSTVVKECAVVLVERIFCRLGRCYTFSLLLGSVYTGSLQYSVTWIRGTGYDADSGATKTGRDGQMNQ